MEPTTSAALRTGSRVAQSPGPDPTTLEDVKACCTHLMRHVRERDMDLQGSLASRVELAKQRSINASKDRQIIELQATVEEHDTTIKQLSSTVKNQEALFQGQENALAELEHMAVARNLEYTAIKIYYKRVHKEDTIEKRQLKEKAESLGRENGFLKQENALLFEEIAHLKKKLRKKDNEHGSHFNSGDT